MAAGTNIFTLMGTILVDSSKAEDSISKTEKKAEGFGTKLGSVIGTAAKVGTAVVAGAAVAGGALLGLVNKASEAASNIDDMSQRTGVAAEEFQKYAYAAKLSGMEAETLEKAMIKQQKAFADASEGSKVAAEAYQRLGIDISNLSSGEAFDKVIMSLASMEDETQRNAIANDIFGKSYAELGPLLNEGADGIAKLKQEAVDMGTVMSDDAVAAGAKFGDMVDSIKMMVGGMVNTFGTELMPMLIMLLSWIQSKAPEIKGFVGEVVDFIKYVIAGLTKFWQDNGDTIIVTATYIFDTVKNVVQIGMDIIKSIIDVVMGIITGDWKRVWNGLKGILQGAFSLIEAALKLALDTLVTVLTGAVTLFFNAGKAIFQGVWDGMKNIWESLTNWVTEKIDWLKEKLAFWRSSKAEMGGGDGGRDDPEYYASGTDSARRGWNWVGEEGPELVKFSGGEMVLSNKESRQAIGGTAINGNIYVTVQADDLKQVGDVLDLFRRLPQVARQGV